MITVLAGAQPAPRFAVLLAEHDRVGELLAQLSTLMQGYDASVPALMSGYRE